MKCVELFAGIGGFRIASDYSRLSTVWANDSCPLAAKVYKSRFGDDVFVHDDLKRVIDTIPEHDLLTAGFPCQPFSSAGKKQGIRDPRGTLFHTIIQILQKHSPRFFVLENVKRILSMENGQHFATILSALSDLNYQVEWRLINATYFGLPQNRERVFIIGTLNDYSCVNSNPFWQKSVFNVKLINGKDLESQHSSSIIHSLESSRWSDVVNHDSRFPTWGIAWKNRFFGLNISRFSDASEYTILKTILEHPDDVDPIFDFTSTMDLRLATSEPVNRFVGGVELLSNQGGGARMGYTVFGVHGVAPTLTAATSRHYERYKVGTRYRRLTNIEYARIQGFPDTHCEVATIYQQYSLLGNAVPPPMVRWVLERLNQSGILIEQVPPVLLQGQLF